MSWNLFLYFFPSAGIKLKLCIVSVQDRARPWAALRAKRTKVPRWSISRRTRWCRTPTPPPSPRLTWATTGQIPPSYSRISLPHPHLPPVLQISTTASHRLEAPHLPWLPLEGCHPLSPALCPTHSLVLSQVSSGLYCVVVATLTWNQNNTITMTFVIYLPLSLLSVILLP